ncbi:hypothetical protein NUW54_g4538 [Trametes sanguinea]|uniref:Uncharacterized protein n=1 Tax=Trametes sanguinea TaxID=158606 RepID=A0ACC1Q0Q1_9APHY|nr:hypothetical protein NUW54_g4538 [Trametes sanguinea]
MSLRDAVSGLDGLPASVVSTDKFFLRCLIVGCTLSTILYGITLQQAYLYYARYPRDKLPLKLFVAVLVTPRFSILDTVATIFMVHGLDTYVVVDYLQPEKMSGLVWSLTVRAESPFARASLNRDARWPQGGELSVYYYLCHGPMLLRPAPLDFEPTQQAIYWVARTPASPASWVWVISGMWLTANMALNPGFSAFATQRPRVLTLVYSGCSSVCDVFITAGLCYYLHTNKSGVKRSNSLIDKLMIYAVQRGIITLICQAYDFLTVSCAMPKREPAIYASFETLIAPTSFLFIPVALMQMKVYTNSLLATLNVRESLKSSDATIVELQSHSLVFAPPVHVQAPHDPSAVRVRAIPHSQIKVCDANGEEAESTTVRSSGSEVKVGGLGDETEVSAASYGLAAS